MSKILDIFVAPTKVFTSLKQKPEWVLPFIILLVVVALSTIVTLTLTRDAIMAQQEEVMRQRGMSEEQIEQALKVTHGPVMAIVGGITAAIFMTIVLLLFAFIVNLLLPVFGGSGSFKPVFAVMCFSSLVLALGSILKLLLVIVTKSPFVTTSLALLVPNLDKASFLFKVLANVDFFVIWEMILVALGISITNGIKKQSAYVLVFLVWIASVFVGIGIGVFQPRA